MVMHEIECSLYYKGHIEWVKMDIYNLGRIEVILGILWLAVHNLNIDWEKEKIKMTRCLPLCERNQRKRKNKEKKQVRREEKSDKETLKKLVPKRFWR